MAIYTLYPQGADGEARTFRAYDLASDEVAISLAAQVLREHTSASSVAIWRDDAFVAIVTGSGARDAPAPIG